jgi:REP element-mobilizing transposase RayT
MRYWLVTWTTFGTWLPGARADFVSRICDEHGNHVIHNIPGTPYDADMPEQENFARSQMKGPPVCLDRTTADTLIKQFQETARIRGWELEAASVMHNHMHLVVGVDGDPDPQSILETFKSWATRAIKKVRPLPPNGTFWTAKGSKRKRPDDSSFRNAVIYVVRTQPDPLAVCYAPTWQTVLDTHDLEVAAGEDPGANEDPGASRTP